MISNFDYVTDLQTDLIYVHDDVAVAEVSCWVDDDLVKAVGIARREPADKADLKLASLLANGRALQSLAAKIMKRANGLIKHNDDMRAIKTKPKPLTTNLSDCWCQNA